MLLFRHRFLLLIKTRFGVEQEVILDELLRQGQDSAFELVVRVTKRINESLEGKLLMSCNIVTCLAH